MELMGRHPIEHMEVVFRPLFLVLFLQALEYVTKDAYFSAGLAFASFVVGVWVPAYVGWKVVKRHGGRVLDGVISAAIFNAIGSAIAILFSFSPAHFGGIVIVFIFSLCFWVTVAAIVAGFVGFIARNTTEEARGAEAVMIASAVLLILASFAMLSLTKEADLMNKTGEGNWTQKEVADPYQLAYRLVDDSFGSNCVSGSTAANSVGDMHLNKSTVGRVGYKNREACHSVVDITVNGSTTTFDYFVLDKKRWCGVDRETGEQECTNLSWS